MVLTPAWPFILHLLITLLFAIVLTFFLRSHFLILLISLAAAIGVSLVWREAGDAFMTYWSRFIEQPILRGGFFRDPSSDRNLLGVLFNLVFPAILAYWISVVTAAIRSRSVASAV